MRRLREARGETVADDRSHDVVDGAILGVQHQVEGGDLHERQELAVVTFPFVHVALEPAVGRVHADDDVGFLDPLPERIELGQRERAPTVTEVGHRRRAHEDGLGATLDDPFEFLDRLVDDRQRDDRRGEDPVLEVERPLLVHPLVERVDDDVARDRIVGEAFLEQARQRRPHHRPVNALVVHQSRCAPRARRTPAATRCTSAVACAGTPGRQPSASRGS